MSIIVKCIFIHSNENTKLLPWGTFINIWILFFPFCFFFQLKPSRFLRLLNTHSSNKETLDINHIEVKIMVCH